MFAWLSAASSFASRSSHLGRQHLDRDLAPEPGVGRPVHLAHAPDAERADDLVRAESRPLPQAHIFAIAPGRWPMARRPMAVIARDSVGPSGRGSWGG
jgi:hypothetical protein